MNSRSPDAVTEAPICCNLRARMKELAYLVLSPAAERSIWATPSSVCGS